MGGSSGEDDGEGGPLVLLEAELGGSKPGDWAGEGHRGWWQTLQGSIGGGDFSARRFGG